MDGPTSTAAVDRLEREIFAQIPLAVAMGLRVAAYRAGRLRLAAPIGVNHNHAGTAFGGSIECLATLAGWGLLWLRLAAPAPAAAADIVIHRAETRFLAPLAGELQATAVAPPAADWRHFRAMLERRGRGRITLEATVGDAVEARGAQFRGSYVVRGG